MDDEDEFPGGDLFDGTKEVDKSDSGGSASFAKERPRGILSDADRDYLRGETDYKHAPSEANRRQTIRERITHALLDFELLSAFLDREDLKKIFTEAMDREELNRSLESMVTFTYLGLEREEDLFEHVIETGVYLGSDLNIDDGKTVLDIDVTIDIEYSPDIYDLIHQLENGKEDQLTPAEIGILVRSGRLEPDHLKKLKGGSG